MCMVWGPCGDHRGRFLNLFSFASLTDGRVATLGSLCDSDIVSPVWVEGFEQTLHTSLHFWCRLLPRMPFSLAEPGEFQDDTAEWMDLLNHKGHMAWINVSFIFKIPPLFLIVVVIQSVYPEWSDSQSSLLTMIEETTVEQIVFYF